MACCMSVSVSIQMYAVEMVGYVCYRWLKAINTENKNDDHIILLICLSK